MYEELYEPIPQTKPYLKRLGLTAVPAADKENLDRLIYAHQLHVPSRIWMCVNSREPHPCPSPLCMKRSC